MGYYPTPEPIAMQIGRLLTRADSGPLRAFDPCCGEGTALHLAVESLGASIDTYGVELDRDRATAAKGILHTVLHADLRHLRVTPQAFGLLWLNPPYDWDTPTNDDAPADRLELRFLQETLRYLQPAGILVYLIPQHRLSAAVAKILASRFDHVQIFRFPDPYYHPYRQVVILGVKTPHPIHHSALADQLTAVGRELVQPPPLPDVLTTPYRIPDIPSITPLVFRSTLIDPDTLLAEVDHCGAFPLLLARIAIATQTQLRPMMPLRQGHLALVLASGHLNNEIVTDATTGERLLVKGTVIKETSTVETDDDGITTTIERDVLTIAITTLNLATGHVQVLR